MRNLFIISLLIACEKEDNINELDLDGDGYLVFDDCNDQDQLIHPEAEDSVGDGVDQNCDNVDGVDEDGDGIASVASGGADCQDQSAEIHPEAIEVCDEIDNDCDGLIDSEDVLVDGELAYLDVDGDGFGDPTESQFVCATGDGWVSDSTDCDDSDASVPSDSDLDCDGVPQEWDCDDRDASNACQFSAVETLNGRWHCSEGGHPNLPNFQHLGGNFFHLVFDWFDEEEEWCRKLGLIEITAAASPTDFEWVLHHVEPEEEEDFHWRTYPNTSVEGEFYWEHDLTTLSTWNDSFPESFAVSCERCGDFDAETTCDVPDPPYPIDYDYPVPEDYICKPVNFTNIGQ